MTQTNKPINKTLETGDYIWCGCLNSNNLPFCSKEQGGDRCKQAKPFTIKEEGWFKLCGCGKSSRPPYCDGTHNQL